MGIYGNVLILFCAGVLALTVPPLVKAYRGRDREQVLKALSHTLCFALMLLGLLPPLRDYRHWGQTGSLLFLAGALMLWMPNASAWLARRKP